MGPKSEPNSTAGPKVMARTDVPENPTIEFRTRLLCPRRLRHKTGVKSHSWDMALHPFLAQKREPETETDLNSEDLGVANVSSGIVV